MTSPGLSNQFANVPVVVTSHVVGYQPVRLRDAEFRHFMLQDLDAPQITDFVNRWHEVTFDDPRRRRSGSVCRRRSASPSPSPCWPATRCC